MHFAWQAQHKRQHELDVLGDQGGDFLRGVAFGA